MKKEKYLAWGMIAVLFLFFISCGGGSGSSGGSENVNTTSGAIISGIFKDSTVSGIGYSYNGGSGITDTSGVFSCDNSSDISFFLGNVNFGSSKCKGIITPVDLIPNGTTDSFAVINTSRFLLMLDSDGNPDNGIVVSPPIQDLALTWPNIDFSVMLETQLDDIIAQCQSSDGGQHSLPSSLVARSHLEKTIRCNHAEAYIGEYDGDQKGFICFIVDAQTGYAYGMAYEPTMGIYDKLIGHTPITYEQSPIFSMTDPPGMMEVTGEIAPDGNADGLWQNSDVQTSGTFYTKKLDFEMPNNYIYKFVGLIENESNGVISIALDDYGNITGIVYHLESGTQYVLSGTAFKNTFVARTSVEAFQFTGTINTSTGDFSGTYLYLDTVNGSFSGRGCY